MIAVHHIQKFIWAEPKATRPGRMPNHQQLHSYLEQSVEKAISLRGRSTGVASAATRLAARRAQHGGRSFSGCWRRVLPAAAGGDNLRSIFEAGAALLSVAQAYRVAALCGV